MTPSARADACEGCGRPPTLAGPLTFEDRAIETVERRRVTTVGADVRDRVAVARMAKVALCAYCRDHLPKPADPTSLRPVTVRRKGKGRTR